MTIENNENKYKELLEVGQEFKNIKDLCNRLNEQYRRGNSRDAQLKRWSRYFSYSVSGHRITITEVYSFPLPLIDKRIGGNNKVKTSLKSEFPNLSLEWMTEKNGKLTRDITRRTLDEYWWKCSKCLKEIFTSPNKRTARWIVGEEELFTCHYCSLSKDAKKIYDVLEMRGIPFSMEYTFDDLTGLNGGRLRFDFAIFNSNSELATLIEYDGEYHDEGLNPCSENYQVLSVHDKMKDTYCQENNISLLRIHHKDSKECRDIVRIHLNDIGIWEDFSSIYEEDCNPLTIDWKIEIEEAKRKIEELEKEIKHLQDKVEVWS